MNNLPRVVTQPRRPNRESNKLPLDRKSDALHYTTASPASLDSSVCRAASAVFIRRHADQAHHYCSPSDASHAKQTEHVKSNKVAHTRLPSVYRVQELIPVLGSQPAGDVSHKRGGTLPLLSARPAVTPATLKRAATNFAAW